MPSEPHPVAVPLLVFFPIYISQYIFSPIRIRVPYVTSSGVRPYRLWGSRKSFLFRKKSSITQHVLFGHIDVDLFSYCSNNISKKEWQRYDVSADRFFAGSNISHFVRQWIFLYVSPFIVVGFAMHVFFSSLHAFLVMA